MNTYSTKPMPYGAKLRKLYAGEFLLSPADKQEALAMLTGNHSKGERDLINLIDQRGEWLD